MKKRFGAFLAAGVMSCTVFAGVALTGCGGSKITDFVMPEGGYDGRAVEITFANTMGANKTSTLEAAIVRFNAIYPNIKVNIDNNTKDWTTFSDNIATRITTGRQPNVAYCYSDHVALYNQAKAVVPLDQYFLPGSGYENVKAKTKTGEVTLGLTEPQVSDYIEPFYEEGSVYGDDHVYTLPFAKSTEVLFYNKTVFDELHLSVPTTWEEMEDVCKTLVDHRKDDSNFVAALGYDSESNLFITMCEQSGSEYTSLEGEHYRFDNETNRAFVSKFKTWYESKYMTTEKTGGKFSSYYFKDKQCYMSIGSTGGSSYQDPGSTDDAAPFEVGVAAIPQLNPAQPKTILQGPSVCIFKKSNPYEVLASWLLVKFLTTDIEFQGKFSEESGYAPVTYSTYNSDLYKEFLAENSLTAKTSQVCYELAQSRAFYVSPAFIGSSTARNQVGTLLKTVLQGTNIDTAFKKAMQECQQIG